MSQPHIILVHEMNRGPQPCPSLSPWSGPANKRVGQHLVIKAYIPHIFLQPKFQLAHADQLVPPPTLAWLLFVDTLPVPNTAVINSKFVSVCQFRFKLLDRLPSRKIAPTLLEFNLSHTISQAPKFVCTYLHSNQLECSTHPLDTGSGCLRRNQRLRRLFRVCSVVHPLLPPRLSRLRPRTNPGLR